MVTRKSAEVPTVVLDVDELLAALVSVLVVETLAVLVMVKPLPSLALAWTTITKVALLPAVSVPMVPVMVPVPPTGGLVKEKAGPEDCDSETNVVPAGTVSVKRTVWASLGPLSLTVTV